MEEKKLTQSDIRLLRGTWRTPHMEDLHNLHSSSVTTRVVHKDK